MTGESVRSWTERRVWLRTMAGDTRLGHAPRLLGCLLADHLSGKSWETWPGRQHLADIMSVTPGRISEHLAALRNTGWITRVRSDRTRVFYALTWGLPPSVQEVAAGDPSLTGEQEASTPSSLPGEREGSEREASCSPSPSLPAGRDRDSSESRNLGGVEGVPEGQPPTHTKASARAPVPARPGGRRPGLGLRLIRAEQRDVHAFALVDTAEDPTKVAPELQARELWAAVRSGADGGHDPACPAKGCREFHRDRSGGVVVAVHTQDVGGLVEALRAAGVATELAPVA